MSWSGLKPPAAAYGAGSGGQLQSKFLRFIHTYTLARFGEQDVREGGVDLVKVQTDLEELIDVRLVAKLRGGLDVWTILVILGLPARCSPRPTSCWLY